MHDANVNIRFYLRCQLVPFDRSHVCMHRASGNTEVGVTLQVNWRACAVLRPSPDRDFFPPCLRNFSCVWTLAKKIDFWIAIHFSTKPCVWMALMWQIWRRGWNQYFAHARLSGRKLNVFYFYKLNEMVLKISETCAGCFCFVFK